MKTHEIAVLQLLTIHNVQVMNKLMADIRFYIKTNNYQELKNKWNQHIN
jgi:tRNA-guanine family transglycosylase